MQEDTFSGVQGLLCGHRFYLCPGAPTICLLMLELGQELPIKTHSCQAVRFHHAEGKSLESPADFDRHLLILCQLLLSFSVRTS